jgi:flagellar motor switch protein FliG
MDVIDYAAASLPLAAAAKKQRVGNNDIENITMAMPEEAFCLLLSIPKEVLEHVLSYLDANSLANVAQTVKAFRVFDAQSGLRLVDKIAKAAVIQAAGEDAERWR